MEKQISISKLLKTNPLQELIQFWDTHDLTDFADELEEVAEPVFTQGTVVNVHLSATEAATVERIARANGIDPSALIRQWVVEKAQCA